MLTTDGMIAGAVVPISGWDGNTLTLAEVGKTPGLVGNNNNMLYSPLRPRFLTKVAWGFP